MVTDTQVSNALQAIKVAYELGVEDACKELIALLEKEEQNLRQYGRTGLYGVHTAIGIVKEMLDARQKTMG